MAAKLGLLKQGTSEE